MTWKTILAPLSGAESDELVLKAAEALAAPFSAKVVAAYVPADAAELMPWMGEGFMGGVQVAALESVRSAAAEGLKLAEDRFAHSHCPHKQFLALESPVSASLCTEARYADVAVFSADAANSRGALVDAFQRTLMEEHRPVLVAKRAPSTTDTVAVAWDGGREAAGAIRRALPWLRHAERVVVLAATKATPRSFDPQRIIRHLADNGVVAELKVLDQGSEPAPIILSAVKALGAKMLVAGAFGHPRFQQFIFGGTTRALMQAEEGPSLFLSH